MGRGDFRRVFLIALLLRLTLSSGFEGLSSKALNNLSFQIVPCRTVGFYWLRNTVGHVLKGF